ncbi:GNAT family N-acetyltransferase [Ruegeria sp. Ofav3-42]|uniref:GNAT family N-acetyltransferase n=1 Tax=Ruegeria sp. Ofav3-42 TaxID=2917759 RepID=UPI001EF564EE|nr:GNAT family N-acetyltransferase [Ruegeria sp. Ofav3-42]MCG7518505.1 GNAT family N-acetyltransferase [Ruegeria sp. Ofav3-42]
MSRIMFRRALPTDTVAVKTCIAAAYADALRDIPDLPDVTEGVGDDIAAHQAWVAEAGGEIVGFVVFDRVDDVVMIFNLAVSPKAQGSGLARKLLAKAKRAAREAGVSKLRLRTHRLMQGTISMYLHLGWSQTEGKGNGIVMEKQLA